jgi:hypothetical protein
MSSLKKILSESISALLSSLNLQPAEETKITDKKVKTVLDQIHEEIQEL